MCFQASLLLFHTYDDYWCEDFHGFVSGQKALNSPPFVSNGSSELPSRRSLRKDWDSLLAEERSRSLARWIRSAFLDPVDHPAFSSLNEGG